jgi:hypothetical protein
MFWKFFPSLTRVMVYTGILLADGGFTG